MIFTRKSIANIFLLYKCTATRNHYSQAVPITHDAISQIHILKVYTGKMQVPSFP